MERCKPPLVSMVAQGECFNSVNEDKDQGKVKRSEMYRRRRSSGLETEPAAEGRSAGGQLTVSRKWCSRLADPVSVRITVSMFLSGNFGQVSVS